MSTPTTKENRNDKESSKSAVTPPEDHPMTTGATKKIVSKRQLSQVLPDALPNKTAAEIRTAFLNKLRDTAKYADNVNDMLILEDITTICQTYQTLTPPPNNELYHFLQNKLPDRILVDSEQVMRDYYDLRLPRYQRNMPWKTHLKLTHECRQMRNVGGQVTQHDWYGKHPAIQAYYQMGVPTSVPASLPTPAMHVKPITDRLLLHLEPVTETTPPPVPRLTEALTQSEPLDVKHLILLLLLIVYACATPLDDFNNCIKFSKRQYGTLTTPDGKIQYFPVGNVQLNLFEEDKILADCLKNITEPLFIEFTNSPERVEYLEGLLSEKEDSSVSELDEIPENFPYMLLALDSLDVEYSPSNKPKDAESRVEYIYEAKGHSYGNCVGPSVFHLFRYAIGDCLTPQWNQKSRSVWRDNRMRTRAIKLCTWPHHNCQNDRDGHCTTVQPRKSAFHNYELFSFRAVKI